jgi:hypothetical protein
MAVSITGAAALAATTKLTPADGAYLDYATPRLHFTDGDGRHVTLRQCASGPGNNFTGVPTPMVQFSVGGQQGDCVLRLTQANANDILAQLVNFANNGVIS